MDSFCICYNLASQKFLGIPVLPEAYIVPVTDNKLGYVEKQATAATLESFGIEYLDTSHVRLLEICASLKPALLEQKFRPAKKRKSFGLTEIMQEPTIKNVAASYINEKLAEFYSLIVSNNYPIIYHAQRKDPFEVHRLEISTIKLEPILEFTKIEDGIEYAFSLKNEDRIIKPQNQPITILLNSPSYITMDKTLFQIQNLNANKLKPFFDKEKITIAPKHIKTYLDKVIIPVIKNVSVSAKGFDIIMDENMTSYGIEIVQDFITQNYVIKAFFNYGDTTFDYNSKKKTASNVDYDEQGEIRITQIKRNDTSEKETLALLTAKGLALNENLFFEENTPDTLGVFNWIQQNHKQLQDDGFEIILPTIEDKDINIDEHSIEVQNKKKMTGSTSKES